MRWTVGVLWGMMAVMAAGVPAQGKGDPAPGDPLPGRAPAASETADPVPGRAPAASETADPVPGGAPAASAPGSTLPEGASPGKTAPETTASGKTPAEAVNAALEAAWAEGGEAALREYVRRNRAAVTGEAIVGLAHRGKTERADPRLSETRLTIALAAARETGDTRAEAEALLIAGDYHRFVGDAGKALAFYDRAHPLFVSLGDPQGQGGVFLGRGDLFLKTGRNAEALALYEKALPLFEKVGSPRQGNVYQSLGDLFFFTGRNARALEMYEKALPFFEKADDPLGQGNVYRSRGNVHTRTGEYAQALAMYGKAVPFFEKAGNPLGLGYICRSRGDICARTGEYEKALAMYEKALPFFGQAGDPVGQGSVYVRRGEVFAKTGGNARALAMYGKALEYYTRCGNPESLACAWCREGHVHAREGRERRALELFERALDLLDQVRRRTGIEELKAVFMEEILDYFEGAARFMLENRFGEKAFRTAERMKARLFLDRLAEGLADLAKGVPPELKARQSRLESRIEALRKQKADLYGATLPDAERQRRVTGLTSDLEQAEAEMNELEAGIRLRNPLYASVQYPGAPSADEVRTRILRPDEALVEYFLTPQDAWCFVLTAEAFRAVKLPLTPAELTRRVTCVLAGAAGQGGRGKSGGGKTGAAETVDPVIEANTRRLYNGLLAPVGKEIRGKTLIIVPDGVLSRLPFEMLTLPGKGAPVRLMDRHPVRYVPSAAVLAFYRTTYRKEGNSTAFIGFGDPVYDWENFRTGRPERGMPGGGGGSAERAARQAAEAAEAKLGRLPGTGEEVEAIAALFAGQKAEGRTLLREAAREEAARSEEMAKYGYIHLAAHGLLGDDFQAIALSRLPESAEDGLLSLGEIMNLNWDARVVVLSACETGLGPLRRGEGVTSLARAVMYAGSPAAVVSLWSVSDEGTKELMTRFYGHMIREQRSPAEALRQAKREMAADPAWSSPFFWAAFVLYGE